MFDDHSDDIARRPFLKGLGAAAGATALGVGATGAAAAHDGFHTRFANPRVQEAAQVWAEKPWRSGYRGRPDRTLAINDSGVEIAHPDLGPWNEVTAIGSGRSGRPEVRLTDPDSVSDWRETRRQVGEERSQTTVLGPGTTIEGSDTAFPTFTIPEGEDIVDFDAALSWQPQNAQLPDTVPFFSSVGEDQSFRAEVNIDGQWLTLKTVDTGGNPETLTNVPAFPGKEHRFVAGQFANVVAQGEVTYTFHTYDDELDTLDGDVPLAGTATDGTPFKTVGWFDSGSRYGTHSSPADPNSHGSHVASITGGTGRASAVDDVTEEAPRAVLTAGDTLQYEVTALPGTGVFGVATGQGVEVQLEGPEGRTLRTSPVASDLEDARIDHPTVDDRHAGDAAATYTVVVRPAEGELASTARVEEVTVGSFADPGSVSGDREAGGDVSLHAGMAPDANLVGIQGLSGPVATMGLYGEELTETFKIRAMNSSWGGLVPGGGTIGGSSLEATVKRVAESGVLLVAAAGNYNGTINTIPAIADEAVSVAATDDLDGVTSYTDGGAQAQDEDDQGAYGKPDVCAPGGTRVTGARAARAESDGAPSGTNGVRDYTNKGGTSMASPYTCGTVGLIAQAMEEDAPDAIALPEPGETGLEDVLRLKQVLLSTASSTAFTAAPYHKHPVTYRHTGRDTYLGYGRVNPDTAVDAVTRDLFDGPAASGDASASISGTVGLDVPTDSRAIAGFVQVGSGTLEVDLAHSHYAGGNTGMTHGVPWLDLYVHDAENPGRAGTPNVLGSAQGPQGSASVTVDVAAEQDDPTTPEDETETRTLFVVAKLVNVPGVVNGYDVRSRVDLDVAFSADDIPVVTTEFTASGSRSDDGAAFTGGQTDQVQVTVEEFQHADEVAVTDQVPDGWTVDEEYGDVESFDAQTGTVHFEGTVTENEVDGDGSVTLTYFAEAPEGAETTGRYTFGPAEAEVLVPDVPADDTDGELDGDGTDSFGGTDTNTVVGPSSNA